jgi:hypothetical protein
MIDDGYQPMIGKDGEKHMKNSLHYEGLAMDIILTKDGAILNDTEDHRVYGTLWESLHPLCFWGGPGVKEDGLKADGNHYAVTYQNRR